ncbi:hypothetical protein DL96DRAFT_1628216 [Flagelloscypha sp. PMI_526]|nr:hypothetical protein DL96DRAFT_1628216 [Flagelloscypha sp. PMI_526]
MWKHRDTRASLCHATANIMSMSMMTITIFLHSRWLSSSQLHSLKFPPVRLGDGHPALSSLFHMSHGWASLVPCLPLTPPPLPSFWPSETPTSISSPIPISPRTHSPIFTNPNPPVLSLPRQFPDASHPLSPYSVSEFPPTPHVTAGQHHVKPSISTLSSSWCSLQRACWTA